MRINIVEKFDLYERLETLVKSLTEHEESQTICRVAIHDLKSHFSVNRFNKMMNELSEYKWIEEVENFITEFQNFKQNNKYGLELESIMGRLKKTDSNIYLPIVEKIQQLIVLDESVIKNKLNELANFKFEPGIRNIIAVYEREAFGKVVKPDAIISSTPISPIMKIEEGIVFSTNGTNYIVTNDMKKLEKYQGQTNGMFKAAQNALRHFNYIGENTFVMKTPKATFKVIAGDSSNRIFINESEIADKHILTTTLKNAGIIPYADTNSRAMIEFMYENAHSLVEIEFVKNIKTVNESFDIFKLANNEVLVSKYDNVKRSMVLEALDIEGVEELSESLKSKYDLDFDVVVEGLAINTDCMEFERLVESINIADILDFTKVEDTYAKIQEAMKMYKSFDIENQKNVADAYKVLENKDNKLNLDKVSFLLETRNALVDKVEDKETLSESLSLINKELSNLVVEKKVSEKDAKKRLEQIRKSLRKEKLSYGEIAELEALADFIDDDDIELRQAAGLPE